MTEPLPCVICGPGHRYPGETTKTLHRGAVTMVVHHVPAEVCDNCHEVYFDQAVARELSMLFAAAVRSGVKIDVRSYRSKAG